MEGALEDVKRGLRVRRAAMEHNVPKSTLGDHVSGRVKSGALSGPQKYLSDAEEQEFVQFLLCCSAVGYAKTRKHVLALVQRIDESKGIYQITDGWWA